MIFPPKALRLKNGAVCILRSPAEEDAEAVLDYLRQTSAETDFLTRYPDEITLSAAKERELLRALAESPRNLMIAAFIDGALVGNASVACVRELSKTAHRASFGIAVRRSAWGVGVGSALLTEILDQAAAIGYDRLELEVVAQNRRAVALYEKFGFEICGKRPDAFRLRDGTCLDDLLMTRKL